MDRTGSTSGMAVSAPSTEIGPGADVEPTEEITSLEGIPALSLDAISSVAYGPEAMLVVLASAGAGAVAKIEPITVAIVVLLVILGFSYRHPTGSPSGAGARPPSSTRASKREPRAPARCSRSAFSAPITFSRSSAIRAIRAAMSEPVGMWDESHGWRSPPV